MHFSSVTASKHERDGYRTEGQFPFNGNLLHQSENKLYWPHSRVAAKAAMPPTDSISSHRGVLGVVTVTPPISSISISNVTIYRPCWPEFQGPVRAGSRRFLFIAIPAPAEVT
jgi:hypothetical protein